MWEVIITGDNIIQVIPVNDLEDHSVIVLKGKDGRDTVVTSNCPCQPRFQFEGASTIIVHKSYDLREAVEQIHDLLNG